MPRVTLAEYFEDFRQNGAQIAYVHKRGYRTERWTYRAVYERALQFAASLDERNIAKGDRVLLWGENCAEWAMVYFACALRGVVVVPIDDGALSEFALRVARQVSAKVVVCARKHAEHFDESARVILEDVGKGALESRVLGSIQVSPSDPLEVVFTSGTTAEPSGVVITHGNVVANVAPLETEIRKYLKYERWVHPVRFLNMVPLSHVFGQFLGLYLPPLMAGTVIFQNTLNPAEVMQTIRRERVSVLVAVPRMLQSLKERVMAEVGLSPQQLHARLADSAGRHFTRRWWIFRKFHQALGWKFWAIISGGSALDAETEDFWRGLGYAVVQGYGLTETTSLISVNHPFRTGKGSIGKVLGGREVRLAEDGEILVRGGGVAQARWSENGAEPLAGEGGWYHTGDVGEIDGEGNLYFKGRKKETIVTPAGMNIYPADLEAALRVQPGVRDCAVVSLPKGSNAEPCAVLLLRSASEDPDAILRGANAMLAEYQRMRVIYLWTEEDFPRTSTGKARRAEIEKVVRNFFVTAESTSTAGSVVDAVANLAGQPRNSVSSRADLGTDLGLTSLERVELMSTLESRYQVDLSESQFADASTVEEIQELLRKAQPGKPAYHYPRWTLRWPVTWIRATAYYSLVRPAVTLLGSPRIVGRDRLAGVHGPVLVVSNHIDHVDVGFIMTALPARLRYRLATAAGGEALELLRTPTPGRGALAALLDRIEWALGVALLNLFPLPRDAGFRKSFAYAGEAIDRGFSILVFPEGRHSTNGAMNPFQIGIGLLAANLQIPVVPMRIDGLFEVKRAGKRFAAPGRIRVLIGSPVRFDVDDKPEQIAKQLQARVAEL